MEIKIKRKYPLYLILALVFLSCSSNIHRNSIYEISSVDIKMNNGEIVNGKLGFPIHFNQQLLFFKSPKNKVTKIKSQDVVEVSYNFPEGKVVFLKTNIVGNEIATETENNQFLQLISKGKINLYRGYNYGFLHKKNKKQKFLQKTDLYFCKKENELHPTLIFYVDNEDKDLVNSKAQAYFSSIPEFKMALKNEKYNPEFLTQFINNYNNENN